MSDIANFQPKVCGACKMPVHYSVGFDRGLWYHDHSGQWRCDNGQGDANTWQVPA